ncbi:protein phosphatase 2C domain-containing protein [Streptomyces tsukubensis]|uniref:protein phosphatase 2C domain-containing protein n=1 Tax=Streptomyces tsukubensis TaxID=83656 RepID=UPI0009903270|nr:protein phosphatase 2C domain-containing protein [Streptomyces tsukubensis]QFR96183.1 hypothetical protein GBW32_28015 [Streptomyces tsukubensis]
MIVAGAAVQGTGHLAAGQGCQDAFKAVDLGGTAVLAVADGAGGRERSALGAHIAVDTACRVLAEDIPDAGGDPEAWTRWIAGAGARVVEEYLRSVTALLPTMVAATRAGTGLQRKDVGVSVRAADGSGAGAAGTYGDGSGGSGPSGGDGSAGFGPSPGGSRAGFGPSGGDRPLVAPVSGGAEPVDARAVGVPPVDVGALAATLVAAVVRPPWVAFVSVGDCFGTVLTRTAADAGAGPATVTGTTGSGGTGSGVGAGAGSRAGSGSDSGTDSGAGAGSRTDSGAGPRAGMDAAAGPASDAVERCHLVLPPAGSEGPGSGPVFLSSPGAALRARSFVVWEPELSGVVLATDGCVPLSLDHPSARELPLEAGPLPSERFFCGLASVLRGNDGDAEPLRALLSGPGAARTGDDLTVLCALVDGE